MAAEEHPPAEMAGLSGGDAESIDAVLDQLRHAGQHPDRGLLDRVKALGEGVIPRLIAMALDEELLYGPSDDPAVWAPLHAISLLGELRAAEAVTPLLPLFAEDDDWLPEALAATCGQIGLAALPPLIGLVRNRSTIIGARLAAISGIEKIGAAHPELRNVVTSELVQLLDRPLPVTAEDAEVNGFLVSALVNLKAVDTVPAIEHAFKSNRVDSFVISPAEVERELGILMSHRAKPTVPSGPAGHATAAPQRSPISPITLPGIAARKRERVGRNDRCPCGSGKKYKKCCGR